MVTFVIHCYSPRLKIDASFSKITLNRSPRCLENAVIASSLLVIVK
jgi:hypothetical protein